MNASVNPCFGPIVRVSDAPDSAGMIFVCEHASPRIPGFLKGMGLPDSLLKNHIAWDIGAAGLARNLATLNESPLVEGCISRLVYDCNRPPHVESAIPEISENHVIPANFNLPETDREMRVSEVFRPFTQALTDEIEKRRAHLDLLVTIHSFTPMFLGEQRDVEIGIYHAPGHSDFVNAMEATRPKSFPYDVRRNEPYIYHEGVLHTIEMHGARNNLAHVMIEIRNDLIETEADQKAMALTLTPWLTSARAHLEEASNTLGSLPLTQNHRNPSLFLV